MSANLNLQPVPTARDHLLAALSTRDELGKQSSAITEKLDKLTPIAAAVDEAQAELQKLLQSESQKLQEWADGGAEGNPPAVDTKARETASRRLADARARLDASGMVRSNLEAELVPINNQLRELGESITGHQMDVLGEAAIRAVEDMRRASLELLRTESAFLAIRQTMQAIRDRANDGSPARVNFSHWLDRISELNRLSDEERIQASQAGHQRSMARIQHLQAGEDPDA